MWWTSLPNTASSLISQLVEMIVQTSLYLFTYVPAVRHRTVQTPLHPRCSAATVLVLGQVQYVGQICTEWSIMCRMLHPMEGHWYSTVTVIQSYVITGTVHSSADIQYLPAVHNHSQSHYCTTTALFQAMRTWCCCALDMIHRSTGWRSHHQQWCCMYQHTRGTLCPVVPCTYIQPHLVLGSYNKSSGLNVVYTFPTNSDHWHAG